MNVLESRIERITEQLMPERPLLYILDLRPLARLGSPGLTPREKAETRHRIAQAAKSGRPFCMVTLEDDRPALPAGPEAIGEGEAEAGPCAALASPSEDTSP